jgi:hypothetical protein
MPIQLTEIAPFPVYDDSGQHDEDFATLLFTSASGQVTGQLRVLLSDLALTQTKEELLALIAQDGAQPVSLTLQV